MSFVLLLRAGLDDILDVFSNLNDSTVLWFSLEREVEFAREAFYVLVCTANSIGRGWVLCTFGILQWFTHSSAHNNWSFPNPKAFIPGAHFPAFQSNSNGKLSCFTGWRLLAIQKEIIWACSPLILNLEHSHLWSSFCLACWLVIWCWNWLYLCKCSLDLVYQSNMMELCTSSSWSIEPNGEVPHWYSLDVSLCKLCRQQWSVVCDLWTVICYSFKSNVCITLLPAGKFLPVPNSISYHILITRKLMKNFMYILETGHSR